MSIAKQQQTFQSKPTVLVKPNRKDFMTGEEMKKRMAENIHRIFNKKR